MSLGKIQITAPFLLLIAFLNYMDQQGIVMLSLLACFLHELGHVMAIRCMGGVVKQIRLTVVGAEISIKEGMSYWRELWAAAAGPGMNLFLCGLFCFIPGGDVFAGLNLVLAVFNLLPLGRLDGGRIASCTLSMTVGPELSHLTTFWLGRVLAGFVLGQGVFLLLVGGSPTLLLTALWMNLLHLPEQHRRLK